MRFGPWDLVKLLFASGNVARHVAKENWSSFDAKREEYERECCYKRDIYVYTDPELEAKYRTMIDDPDMYDEVWSRLEAIRARHRDGCENGPYWKIEDLNDWFAYTGFIEHGRFPFDNIAAKRMALYVLMQEHSRCPMFCLEDYIKFKEDSKGRYHNFIPNYHKAN